MRRATVTAALLTTTLLATGCTGGGLSDAQRGDGDAFVIAWNAQPPTLDPLMTTSTATRDIARNFLEPLVTVDSEGEIHGVLAQEFSTSEDATQVRFTMREGLMFHDGSPVEDSDVVVSLETWIAKTSPGQLFFADAEVSVEASGVIVIDLPEPMVIAMDLLADQGQLPLIQPAEVLEAAGDEPVTEYIGTGPYRMAEWRTDQYVELERFEDYVSPEGAPDGTAGEKDPSFDTILFTFVPDPSTRMSGLQTGEYDAANALPYDNYDMLDNDENIELTSGDNGFNAAVFNKAEGLMADSAMRHAVVAATHSDPIQRAAFTRPQFYTTSGTLMPESSQWHSTVGLEEFEADDQALVDRQLQEAGYAGEEVRILTSREYNDHYNNAVVFSQQLQDAGINAKLVVTDWATVLQNRTDPSTHEIFITGFSPVTLPITYVFFTSTWPGWTESAEIDDAFEAITSAPDLETAVAASDDLQRAHYDYLPIVKFGDRSTITGVRTEFEGHRFVPISGDIFYSVRRAGS